MKQRFEGGDTVAMMRGTEDDIAVVMTAAMRDTTTETRDDWRDQVRQAGLGNRLANTIKGRTYPEGGDSLEPAAWVWTKAPVIIDAFSTGPTIVPINGSARLAIPTDKVPRRKRKRMTPVEVEAFFNQDLILRPGRNGTILAFVDVLASRNGKGFRPATKRRLAQGRKRRLVLMFVLVRRVKVRKRLDLLRIANDAAGRWTVLLDRYWARMPDRTAPKKRF